VKLVPMTRHRTKGLGVALEPVSAEDREALLALFRAVERVDKQWKRRRREQAPL
jgi:hypothetical protein